MNVKKYTNRWWDLPAVFCLVMSIMAVATRLYSTQWTTDLDRVQYLTFFALIVGLALGQSSFSPALVRFFGVIYGVLAIPWQLGLAQVRDVEWMERLVSLAGRLNNSAYQFLNGRQVDDSILFITLMSILFWILGITAGYALTRHGNVWSSIIPSGIAIFIINHYDPLQPAWGRIIGTFLFFTLLLLGRVTYLRYRNEWQESGVAQAPETGVDIGRAGLVAVIVIVLLAWNVPAFAASNSAARQFWVSVTHPWETLRNRFSDAVASLRSTVGVVSDFYGDELSLGTGTRLGDEVVFSVSSDKEAPSGARFYWRARSYDNYTAESGWKSTLTGQINFSPSQGEIDYPDWQSRELIQFTFLSRVSLLRTVYTGPVPVWVSRPGNVIYGISPDGTLDVATIQANPPLRAGETYSARSWLGVPTVSQLRESSAAYPDWVTERYLQLPEDFSPRVRELAELITRGTENPYDKADAITKYLRENITYTTSIAAAPSDIDPIEWFLFNLKEGYCNYYASAEVLMLRSVGVPARMAGGFAQGAVDQSSRGLLYQVRNKDAHAWPEVYFEGYGWVEFEPTVSQPARDLPLGEGVDQTSENNFLPDSALSRSLDELEAQREELAALLAGRNQIEDVLIAEQTQRRNRWIFISLAVAGTALLLIVGWRYIRIRYRVPALPVYLEKSLETRGIEVPAWLRGWSRRLRLTPLERSYNMVNQSLRILGKPAQASATPAERAASLGQVLPPAQEPTQDLIDSYQNEIYGNTPGDPVSARQAGIQIRWLAIKAFLKRLIQIK